MVEPTPLRRNDTGRADRHTDAGNAVALVELHGHRFRWVPLWERWLVYDGRRWRHDTLGEVMQAAKAVAQHRWDEALAMEHGTARDKALGWARQCENAGRLDAMVRLARSEPGVAIDPDALDADPWLLNCGNGTLDLRNGELYAHDPADLITKVCAADYDPDAVAPTWDRFMREVQPDPDMRDYLRRAVGYSLTGAQDEQCIFVSCGTGANGKSVWTGTLRRVLGDYARQASADILVNAEAHPTGVADLQGARFVVASELDDGRRLAEATVKALTGGDRVKARFMRQDFFEFDPSHTLWLATNHRPIITGTDHGIWRRVKLIPWAVTIAETDQDRQLADRLSLELPGVLAWAVRGCAEWTMRGLADPDTVRDATADYRAEMDMLGTFLDDACIADPDARVQASDLYTAYTRWCDDNGERAVTQRRLGQALTERGFDRRKYGPARRWHWFGITVGSFDVSQVNP